MTLFPNVVFDEGAIIPKARRRRISNKYRFVLLPAKASRRLRRFLALQKLLRKRGRIGRGPLRIARLKLHFTRRELNNARWALKNRGKSRF